MIPLSTFWWTLICKKFHTKPIFFLVDQSTIIQAGIVHLVSNVSNVCGIIEKIEVKFKRKVSGS